ncbi:MAG: response regulator transcription factor [Magnetococcus sp. DMHC-1]
MIRVFAVDDHRFVLEGLQRMLADDADIEWQGDAENGRQAIAEIKKNPCDVVLLDVSMPDMDGLELLKRLRLLDAPPKIVIFTMHAEAALAIRFIKAGAMGFVTKNADSRQILQAIHKVADGGRFITPAIAEEIASRLGDNTPEKPHETLSDQEFLVFRRLAAGQGISRIAQEMNLSPSTIGTYRTRILEKFKFDNNAELVRYAMEHGIALS